MLLVAAGKDSGVDAGQTRKEVKACSLSSLRHAEMTDSYSSG